MRSRSKTLPNGFDATDIMAPTILVCSHAQRDNRCGVLGPLLHAEFKRYIHTQKYPGKDASLSPEAQAQTSKFFASSPSRPGERFGGEGLGHGHHFDVNVGMISHVGGHKWAGNVIVYIPPAYPPLNASSNTGNSHLHPLAGKGIWYGRVEPCHVEGIVQETLLQGRVILDLFRGAIDHDGKVMRL